MSARGKMVVAFLAIAQGACALGAIDQPVTSYDDSRDTGLFEPDPLDEDAGAGELGGDPVEPVDPDPEPPSDDPMCDAGHASCGGVCVNVLRDRDNCGACGRTCAKNATGCTAGRCTCIKGQHACGTQCVNLDANEANCGACGHACGASKKCCNGSCKVKC